MESEPEQSQELCPSGSLTSACRTRWINLINARRGGPPLASLGSELFCGPVAFPFPPHRVPGSQDLGGKREFSSLWESRAAEIVLSPYFPGC